MPASFARLTGLAQFKRTVLDVLALSLDPAKFSRVTAAMVLTTPIITSAARNAFM
ncbi:MAG: hypothetical protein AAGF81_05375 [Pseudomonadota bacterium]